MKKITCLLSLLLNINTFGMQSQRQHQPQQTQKKKDQTKQRWHSNDDNNATAPQNPQPEDDILADLKADMAGIVQNIIKANATVDNFIDTQHKQKQKRIILCGICGEASCPYSKEVEE